ncbi:MAG TPA: hypothetical protein VFA08_05020 [Actinomycetota bacterium]|jgi:hypothetical protein|nr:hypothetical protein [Actinomycetota bacterium]
MKASRLVRLAATVALTLTAALTTVAAPAASADGVPDLSTREAIEAYLISIGVDPADAVWQEGRRNYAGPRCPGAEWNCVAATTPIVQIANAGGFNLFACGGLDCVVVQVALNGGQNGSACDRGDNQSNSQVQVCDITQVNGGDNPNSTNAAAIAQNIQQNGGSTQKARQVARIRQENTLGKNISTINQVIGQSQNARGGTTIMQSQEAHQGATVNQGTTEGGNVSNVTQRQDQSQRASRVATLLTQEQNAALGTDFNLLLCDDPDDLMFDQDKNQCADVDQVSVSGTLKSNLRQLINETQSASGSPSVTQVQGTAPTTGGQNGTVDHLSSGLAANVADEDMFQSQTAAGATTLSQTKFTGDPRCCQTQGTNTGDTSSIDQTTNQFASDPDALQNATLSSHCVTTGNCDVMQSSTINGVTNTEECTGSVCEETLTCTQAGGEGGCSTTEPSPGPDLT